MPFEPGWLGRGAGGFSGSGVAPAGRVTLRLGVDEEHAERVRRHQDEHEHGNYVYSHVLVIPRNIVFDASRSAGNRRDDQPPPQAPVGLIPAA
jgi:hypothetical protein